MRVKRLTTAALAIVALAAAACSSSSTSQATGSSAPSNTTPGGYSPGITKTSVTVANIAVLTGVPGLFQGAPYGTSAYFAYQNSKGGVNGRRLVLDPQDDAFSCSQNQAVTQSDINRVFAFVGSFSLFDGCGARVLGQNPTIPDVSFSLDQAAWSLPNNFSPQPQVHGWRTGPLAYYKQNYPQAIRSVAALVGNVSSAIASWNDEKAAMQSLGYHITDTKITQPLQKDFTNEVLSLRDQGVKMVNLTQEDIVSITGFLNTAQQQGWHPLVLTTGGTAYDGNFFRLTNPGAGQGLLNDQTQAMYLGQDRANPEVNLFLTWINRVHPGFQPDIFSVFGWSSAELFTQALEAAGPNPTRGSVMTALQNIHSFNANGLLATADPAAKRPPTCWLLIRVNNNSFQRYQDPPTGFRCDGGYYYDPNAYNPPH